MAGQALKVLCITGWCRNGSTIIGNVLGEVPGFFHVGELRYLWLNSSGKGSNNLCGCGTELVSCPVWSQVLDLGRPADVKAEDYAAVVTGRQQACVRTRHTWRVLRRGLSRPRIRAHAALMTQVYHHVAERMGARVIVDTTKIPGEAALLGYLEGVVPYYVHLVRDPRAVAQSWSREKQYAYVMPAWKSTAYWHGFNLASRAVTRRHRDRSILVRYEDFIAEPDAVIGRVLRLCGIEPGASPLGAGRAVELHPNHTVTGNPDRFRSGLTVIRDQDVCWNELSVGSKLAAVGLSGPDFLRYGYRYRGTLRGRPLGGAVG